MWWQDWCFAALLLSVVVFIFVDMRRRGHRVTAAFKAVVITGCDTGLGHRLARRLDREGFKVFAGCLDTSSPGAQALQEETSPRLQLLQLDVTKEAEIESARQTVLELLGGHALWAVVNNAGVGDHSWFELNPKVNFQRIMEVNFLGMVHVTRAFLPLVRAARGRIINMSSMAGRLSLPGFTAYSSSKAAVIAFSDCLRREVSDFHVKVIVLEPSLYNTGISEPVMVLARSEDHWTTSEAGIRRDFGQDYFSQTQIAWQRLLRFGSDDIEQVVNCYVTAITALHPSRRYSSPKYMKILNDVFTSMPYCFQNVVIRRVMGITCRPDMISVSPTHKLRSGRRRSHAN